MDIPGNHSMLSEVRALFLEAINIRDSLYDAVGENGIAKDPNDSLLIKSSVTKAYEAILAYQQSMAKGLPKLTRCPDPLQLTRVPDADDSSYLRLPG